MPDNRFFVGREKWLVSVKRADFDGWAKEFGISPVIARIIRNRDVTESRDVDRFLNGTLADCHSPWLLYGMEQAVEAILAGIREEKRFRVIGDYDVDGICASYILTEGLRQLGARVDTAIPHRIHDGYGLNAHLIEEAARDQIEMIVTCDNGIAAQEQISLARKLGISVIVTDHHEVPFVLAEDGTRQEKLPPAVAIIDPKQEACHYPFPGICGAVVAYKLIQAMSEKCGIRIPALEGEFLELAALATDCDVMELKDENRIIVKEGLKRMEQSRNLGLQALIEVNGIGGRKLTAYHLGFVIGPCLNATGRLDTALRALELLQSSTKKDAYSAASELKALNDSRKNLTEQGVKQAQQYLLDTGAIRDRVFVIFLPEVHESLAGIIAGRIREQYYHPVFVLTLGEEGVKGSGRSIEAYHMYDNMTAIKHCFSKFGGHKLAAGLTLASHGTPQEDVEAFRRAVNESCTLTEEDLCPRIHIDVPMPLSYPDLRLVKDLEKLEPFGVGNPRPLFAQKDLHFLRGYLMGAKRNCARFRVRLPEEQSGKEAELVFFGDLESFHAFLDGKYGEGSAEKLYESGADFLVSVTYQLNVNTYRGKESLQFIMQNYC